MKDTRRVLRYNLLAIAIRNILLTEMHRWQTGK
jgi:hypothetical protein